LLLLLLSLLLLSFHFSKGRGEKNSRGFKWRVVCGTRHRRDDGGEQRKEEERKCPNALRLYIIIKKEEAEVNALFSLPLQQYEQPDNAHESAYMERMTALVFFFFFYFHAV
jgi:hypothetical protein